MALHCSGRDASGGNEKSGQFIRGEGEKIEVKGVSRIGAEQRLERLLDDRLHQLLYLLIGLVL